MQVSGTYAVWAGWLDGFARGSDASPDGLPPLSEENLGAASAQRLAQRCADAMNARLALWARAYDRDQAVVASVDDQRQALTAARRRLLPIWRFVESDLLFEPLKGALINALKETAERSQQEAEHHARRAPRNREELLRVVLEHPLDRRVDVHLQDEPEKSDSGVPAAGLALLADETSTRKVILG
jgi:hypothetical protein